MKKLVAGFLILATQLSFAQETEIKKGLTNTFIMASLPVTAANIYIKSYDKYMDRFSDKQRDQLYADQTFCLQEKLGWNLIPLSAKKFSRMVNADHPRCQKFKVSYYPNHKKDLKAYSNDELHYFLPIAMFDKKSVDSAKIWGKEFEKLISSRQKLALKHLEEVSGDNTKSAMEVCAAVALTDINESLTASLQNEYYIGYSVKEAISTYELRLKYLAMTVGDWYAKTKGNSNICPNFGLELKVNELSDRVNVAEQKIVSLANSNNKLRDELKRMNKHQDAGVIGLLAAGFVGYKVLTPR